MPVDVKQLWWIEEELCRWMAQRSSGSVTFHFCNGVLQAKIDRHEVARIVLDNR